MLCTGEVASCAADVVIDKSKEDWAAVARRHSPGGFHAIFDANGVATIATSYDLLARNGRLVVCAQWSAGRTVLVLLGAPALEP